MEADQRSIVLLLFSVLCVRYAVLAQSNESNCSELVFEDERSPSEGAPTLYVLSLLPYPDTIPALQPSWDEGPTLWFAEQLAVKHINARSDVLPGYRLELLRGDSGCDIIQKAVRAFVRQIIYEERNIAAVIGPGCSASATILSSLTAHSDVELLNIHIAGSPLLANRKQYPYSFGTLDSTEVFVDTLLALMRKNDWTNVGVLYEESRVYYRTTLQIFEAKIRDLPDYKLTLSSAVYDTYIPLDELAATETRIIILMVSPEFLSKVFCLASHKSLTFPTYQWLIVSRTVEEIDEISFKFEGKSYSCGHERIMSALSGTIVVHYKLTSFNESTKTDVLVTYETFLRDYLCELEKYNNERSEGEEKLAPSFWAPSYYDPVWALALALNNSIPYFQAMNLSLTEYRYGQHQATTIIREQLLALEFEGVSGIVSFNSSNGFVRRAVDIYQVESQGFMKIVGYQSAGVIVELADATYINSHFDSVLVTLPKELTVVSLAFVTAILALISVMHCIMVIFRKRKTIRASSPKLTHLVFIGCYILTLALITYAIIATGKLNSDVLCQLRHLLHSAFSIGCTLIFGTITARTWRLYRIFFRFRNPGSFLSDQRLSLFVLLLLVYDVIICIVWIVVDPFAVDYERTLISDSNGVPMIEVRVVCKQSYYFVWFGMLTGFNAFWVATAFVLALLTRNIPQKDFETRSITLLVYILTIVFGIGFSLYTLSILNSSTLLEFVCGCSLLNILLVLCIMFVFLPPILPLLLQRRHRM